MPVTKRSDRNPSQLGAIDGLVACALREGLSQFGCLQLENLGLRGAGLNLVHGGALAVEVAAPRSSCADRTVNT